MAYRKTVRRAGGKKTGRASRKGGLKRGSLRRNRRATRKGGLKRDRPSRQRGGFSWSKFGHHLGQGLSDAMEPQ